ncbi:MAG: dephospho-CoA kinase [Flavobacteriaceae bacterium]|jgi:dephospho-CoA kinase|uniref:dephospho-CoA kinase n=1 Tax=Candidatus Marifrigoribacter sp. Uisw_064 TaxID=3230970 RepID=UPI003AE0C390
MKIIGLTGGIGSGKSTVVSMFKDFGVPVYIADDEAKKLTNQSKIIKRKLTKLLGEKTYIDGVLNKQFVAEKIFSDTDLLKATNAIIHPKVAKHFSKWVTKQEGTYCLKEAAILFENEGYKKCHATILITCPENIRIERVLKRGGITPKDLDNRLKNQWTDVIKEKLADYVIENIDLEATQKKAQKIHNILSKG